jgi:transcriptional regulator with XRE-family HTH domain
MSSATIGSALIEQRQKRGLDKGQAAEKIGMSRTTYSSYELDAQRPSTDVFPALAAFLEVTTEELLLLYGATSIAVARLSLHRLPPSESGVTRSPDANAEIIQSGAGQNTVAESDVAEADLEGDDLTLVDVEAVDLAASDFDEVDALESGAEHARVEVEEVAPWVSSVTSIDVATPRKDKKQKKKKHRGKKK